MTKPNRDYLLATISSLRQAHEFLGNYIKSGAAYRELEVDRLKIRRLAGVLHGRPELDEFRKHLKPAP